MSILLNRVVEKIKLNLVVTRHFRLRGGYEILYTTETSIRFYIAKFLSWESLFQIAKRCCPVINIRIVLINFII